MNTLVLSDQHGGLLDDHERRGVLYAEHGHNGESGGVAIQYVDDRTEFVPEAVIEGFYDEELEYPFEDDYETWVNTDGDD